MVNIIPSPETSPHWRGVGDGLRLDRGVKGSCPDDEHLTIYFGLVLLATFLRGEVHL